MTAGLPPAMVRPPTMEASLGSKDIINCLSPSNDHMLNNEAWYASSPSSLHIYEQERCDMQSSFFSNVCGDNAASCSKTTNEEFDLNPRYENSEILALDDGLLPKNSCSGRSDHSNMLWECKPETDYQMDDVYQSGRNDEPTLAELNSEDCDLLQAFFQNNKLDLSDVQSSMLQLQKPTSNLSAPLTRMPLSRGVMISQKPSQQCYTEVKQEARMPTATASSIDDLEGPEYKSLLHQLFQHRSQPMDVSHTPLTGNRKRAATDTSMGTVNRKWEEIKEFITDKHQPPEVPIKRERLNEDMDVTVKTERVHEQAEMTVDVNQFSEMEEASTRRQRYDSTSSTLYTSNDDFSDDDTDDDSDIGSDHEDDDWDADSNHSQQSWSVKTSTSQAQKKRDSSYYWQYNVQSKGPKGKRLCLALDSSDPHVLNDFEDPVFDFEASTALGVKHRGKARRGDGNDIVPCPRKLNQFGNQLEDINKQINNFLPMQELPSSARNDSRKQKNKLASRACRLKKKAQHEANKVKLFGLEHEHRQLMVVLSEIKQKLFQQVRSEKSDSKINQPLATTLEQLMKKHLGQKVAGHSSEYVNSVIKKVKEGDKKGGLDI